MVSVYGYITIAELEAYTGINYETTYATYTDAFVDAQITLAERAVRSMCVNPPSAGTDSVIAATMILSERFMRNAMVTDGFAEEMPSSIKAFFDYIIDVILVKNRGMVDRIPIGRGS